METRHDGVGGVVLCCHPSPVRNLDLTTQLLFYFLNKSMIRFTVEVDHAPLERLLRFMFDDLGLDSYRISDLLQDARDLLRQAHAKGLVGTNLPISSYRGNLEISLLSKLHQEHDGTLHVRPLVSELKPSSIQQDATKFQDLPGMS